MDRNEKIPMREAMKLHYWAAKIWWKYDPGLFLSTVLSACVKALIPYVTLYLSAQILDELVSPTNDTRIWWLVGITVGITAMLTLIQAGFERWKSVVHSPEFLYHEQIMAQKMLDMDFVDADSPNVQSLRSEMQYHMNGNAYGFINITGFFCENIVLGLTGVIASLALTVSMFLSPVPNAAGQLALLNHPLIGVAVFLLLMICAVVIPLFGAKRTAVFWSGYPLLSHANRVLRFNLQLAKKDRSLDVRMYDQQDVVKLSLIEAMQKLKDKVMVPMGALGALQGIVSTLMVGVVYLFVCLKAWAGAFGIGSVTQYVGAVTKFCTAVSTLFQIVGQLPQNAKFLKVIKEFLEIPNNMYQGSLPTEKRDDRDYEVEFRDVSFKYPGSDIWALRHVNMKFQVGSRLAVVGMNGSGKTTFIKLLCRLYDPTEGQILLNGIDIRKYEYDDYMSIFSVVFQDFQLVALPLGQNVAASAEYDRARAEDCLRKAGFGDRLDSMPNGLDTYLYKDLEKSGVDVSGGEAQKVAIARALYKDAPFIILDEPTAALDPIAEAEIYSKFNDIAGDKTAIYISHRLSSCKFCDEIAVFHEGAVIQQGTHAALVADVNGKYYELWHAQAQYYTEKTA